jgi:hypothetical protein
MNDYRCDHDPAAVCWLCSDQVPWWREARIRKGLSPEPRLTEIGRLRRYNQRERKTA